MSFILDALDRSRRERDARSLDPLLSPAADDPIAQTAGFPWLRLLLLALLLALGVIAWLWLFRAPAAGPGTEPAVAKTPSRTSPSPSGPSAPVEPAVSPSALPVPAEPAADTVPGAAGAQVSRLYSEARAASMDTRAGADEEAERTRTETVDDAVAGLAPDVERTEGERHRAVEAMVARAEAAMDNLGLAAHPAPMLDELSQAVRDDIPTLIYSQHDYRANDGDSSVLINRERRREGDSMSGVRVQEILTDSVVLSYRGTVFRLRALNSWVNL